MIEFRNTQRGFRIGEFKDRYDEGCSIQESSIMAEEGHIWFGIDDPKPQIMASDAKIMGIPTGGQDCGWVKYPIPSQVHLSTRMHLSQSMVKDLLPVLQYFAEHGTLPE